MVNKKYNGDEKMKKTEDFVPKVRIESDARITKIYVDGEEIQKVTRISFEAYPNEAFCEYECVKCSKDGRVELNDSLTEPLKETVCVINKVKNVESFELELYDFCEGCGHFEADVTKINVSTMEDMFEKTPKFRIYIKCANCEGCRNAVENVKKQ